MKLTRQNSQVQGRAFAGVAKVTLEIFLSERWAIEAALAAGRAKAHPSYRAEASHDARTCQRVELRTCSDDTLLRARAPPTAAITLNAG
jgi:hypothetical protein